MCDNNIFTMFLHKLGFWIIIIFLHARVHAYLFLHIFILENIYLTKVLSASNIFVTLVPKMQFFFAEIIVKKFKLTANT